MAHQFDVQYFERLLADAERLAQCARSHEDRIASFVKLIGAGTAMFGSDTKGAAATGPCDFNVEWERRESSTSADVAAALLEMHDEAREQQRLAELILARLIGDVARKDGQRTVLVVDDTTDSRSLAADVVEAFGFHAITASNGLEAIIVAHYARPAVVLMDIAMPVLNGLEAARLLKASAVTQHLNMIAYTAKADFDEGPLAKFFVDVLPKPTSPDAIIAAVRRFVTIEQ
jgi:CheY-like chemotaxis protein